jgi:hypothetical protein
MWRSFFFAVGIFLFAGGLQCLMFEQFFIDQNNRVLTIAKRAGNAAKSSAQDSYREFAAQPQTQPSRPEFSLPSSYYGGASRFQSPSYNNQTIANELQAGFQSNTPQGGLAGANSAGGAKSLSPYRVNDWVPWCLLAVGTIVCLYTQSLGQQGSRHD